MDDVQRDDVRACSRIPDERVLVDLEGAAEFLRAPRGRQREGRLHRLLHGRPLHAAVRVLHRPPRCGRGLLGRLHRPLDARGDLDRRRAPAPPLDLAPSADVPASTRQSARRMSTPPPRSASSSASAPARAASPYGRHLRRRGPRLLRRLPAHLQARARRAGYGSEIVPFLARHLQLMPAVGPAAGPSYSGARYRWARSTARCSGASG